MRREGYMKVEHSIREMNRNRKTKTRKIETNTLLDKRPIINQCICQRWRSMRGLEGENEVK